MLEKTVTVCVMKYGRLKGIIRVGGSAFSGLERVSNGLEGKIAYYRFRLYMAYTVICRFVCMKSF